MQSHRRLAALSYAAACAAAVLIGPSLARAGDYSWTNTAGGSWAGAGNWTPAGVPAAGDTATFNAAGADGNVNVYLNADQAASLLTFSNTGTTTVAANASGTTARNLTVTSGITVNSGAGAVTIGNPGATGTAPSTGIVITNVSGNVTFTNNSANTLTFALGTSSSGNTMVRTVAGTNTLTLAGPGNMLFVGSFIEGVGATTSLLINSTGTVELDGSNTNLTGGYTINSGNVAIKSSNAFGTIPATLTLNGGSLYSINSVRTIPSAVAISITGNTTIGGTGASATVLQGDVTFGGTAPSVATTVAAATFSGKIDFNGRTPTFNTGTALTLSGQVTGTGGFTKTGTGNLVLLNNSSTAPNNYTGPTTILGGTFTLGSSTVGDATIPSTTAFVLGSGATFAANLTGSMSLGSLSDYQGAGGRINMGANHANVMTIGADNTSTTFSGTFTGTDPMADGGLVKVGTGTLTLTGASTFNGYVQVRNGTLAFTTVGNAGSSTGTALFAPVGGTLATAVAQATIPLGNATTTGTLKYVGTGTATTDRVISLPGTAGGGGLDASGTGPITFTSNLAVTGAGDKTLTLSGTNAGANTLQGTIPDSSAAEGGVVSVTKSGPGQWVLTGANTYTGLTTVGGGTLVLAGAGAWGPVLSPAGADVKGGTLVLDYTGTSSPAGSVFAQVAAGAIKTSNASATVTVGMLDDGTSKITVMATWYGDANLDGRLNADDYALIDRGYNKQLTGWVNGDFNYSGAVDSNDYLLIDATYGASGVSHDAWAVLLAERQAQFGEAYVQSLIASVPEPGTVSLAGLGALALAGRRRRRVSR